MSIADAVDWLIRYANSIPCLNFHSNLYPQSQNGFSIWWTWSGRNPNLKSILIGSHLDTVAVDEVIFKESLKL